MYIMVVSFLIYGVITFPTVFAHKNTAYPLINDYC